MLEFQHRIPTVSKIFASLTSKVHRVLSSTVTHARPRSSPQLKTSHTLGSPTLRLGDQASGNLAFVQQWPALNTLGLSLARLDFNPGGIIMPHTHPLSTEILFCLEGEIYTGFVTNSDNPYVPNKVYAKTVKKGEAFIFPRGLLHFQLNKGAGIATSVNVLNSQNPGFQTIPFALFNSGIDPEVLSKSFFITEAQVAQLTSNLSLVLQGP